MLKLIIFRNVNKNIIKIYDHNNGNSSNNFRCFQLISVFIINKSGHFKQLQINYDNIKDLDNIKISNIMNTTFRQKMEYNLIKWVKKAKKE